MPKKVIYKEKPIKINKEDQGKRRRGPRGWLSKVLDPNEEQHHLMHTVSKKVRATHRLKDQKRTIRAKLQKGESDRKLQQMNRLAWVTEQILRGWDNRKITLEFCKQFNMQKTAAAKYISRIYKDFQQQFTDPGKRNLLMADHCARLKHYAAQAADSGDATDFNAAERLMRQYAEVVGILIAPSMIKFQSTTQDNRQQLFVNTDEMKQTLGALEKLSEQGLFQRASKSSSQGALETVEAESARDVEEAAIGLLHRET